MGMTPNIKFVPYAQSQDKKYDGHESAWVTHLLPPLWAKPCFLGFFHFHDLHLLSVCIFSFHQSANVKRFSNSDPQIMIGAKVVMHCWSGWSWVSCIYLPLVTLFPFSISPTSLQNTRKFDEDTFGVLPRQSRTGSAGHFGLDIWDH